MAEREQDTTEEASATQPRWWRITRTLLIGAGLTALVVILLALVLYDFGGMWLPRPELKAQYEQRVAAGQVQPVENRFVIPIPGCVCHSDDPVVTMQHAERRIRDCSNCHGGGIGPQ